jgi:hypothetical protein
MGYDANAYSAILLQPNKLQFLFASVKFSKAVARSLTRHFSLRFTEIGEQGWLKVHHIWVEGSSEDDFDDRGMLAERMEQVRTGYDLFTLLQDCIYAQQTGKVRKYGSTYINSNVILEMWNHVIGLFNLVTGESVPRISDLVSFGCYQNSGLYEVELGRPYVRFEADEIFERRLTKQGATLQQFITNDVTVSEWV